MSITKILSTEKTPADEKLAAVAEVVAAAREAYGNTEEEIPVGNVNTPMGHMAFTHLEDESKVEVLRTEASVIKIAAVEYADAHPGTVIKRKVEELIATNRYFANISTTTDFSYL